jgi:transposase
MPIDQLPPEDRRPDGEPLPGPEGDKTPVRRPHDPENPSGAVLTEEDKQQVWDSYINGASQRDLAEIYGVNQSTISRTITRFRARLGLESAEEAKRKDISRLEALLDAHWRDAVANKDINRTKLIMAMIDQRGRIFGYTAPLKHRIEGRVGVEHSSTPELSSILERARAQNEAIRVELERQQVEVPKPDDVVDAEIVEEETQ